MEELSSLSPTAEGGRSVLRGRYELGRVIGRGSFAKVYLARNLRTGQNVAMKVVGKEKLIRVGMTEHVKREISVMKMVTHPNIVELHEVMATVSKIYFALELVRGGELFSEIARSGRLSEDVARRYFRQLISAVDFCHSRGVYHRDLKPENLLLDDAGNLKVADFGLSAFAEHVKTDGLLHIACGTPAYVAPEVIGKKGYDGSKADIWSCGVILFVLLAGFLPFRDDNIVAMYRKIHHGDFKCPPWFSSDVRRLIAKLLDPNPKTRITVDKLIESPWFRKAPILKPVDESPIASISLSEEPLKLNAFHLISLSEGFDLSPMFGDCREEGMRFVTKETASGVISRIEELATREPGRMRVTKRSVAGVRIEGVESGRKGPLAVTAEIFAVAPSFLVVDVKKDGGDSVAYRQFCRSELRPALEDIIWASSGAQTTSGA